jgi:hypothetical protein
MEYDRMALNSYQSNAKDKPEDFLVGINVKDQAPVTFKLDTETVVPAWTRSPFTGLPIPTDKQYRTSNGILYHKDELKQHLAASDTPICVVTGKPLTEKVKDIV